MNAKNLDGDGQNFEGYGRLAEDFSLEADADGSLYSELQFTGAAKCHRSFDRSMRAKSFNLRRAVWAPIAAFLYENSTIMPAMVALSQV